MVLNTLLLIQWWRTLLMMLFIARYIDRLHLLVLQIKMLSKYLKEDDGKYTSEGDIDGQGFSGRLVRAEANGTYGPRNFVHMY